LAQALFEGCGMMMNSLCFFTAAAQFFQAPVQPQTYAYAEPQPVTYLRGVPSMAPAAGFATAPTPSSNSGNFLALGCVVSMFAVLGYSIGQSSAPASSNADVEEAFALAALPARAAVARRAPEVVMTSIRPGDIGTTRPLGVYDPLGLMTKNPEKYRRFQELEIKHGRICMLAILHVITTGAGYKWAGYASYLSFPPLKFEDIPAGTLGSWATLPQAGWGQIVAVIAILDNSLFAQDPSLPPGDVVGDRIPWVRYSDPDVKFYKLNAERNNGRAAMMGITGMVIHEALTGNPIWPIDYESGNFPLIPTFAVVPGLFTIS
jgi:light-harvesting complex I chlorophyll a/b binding protein 1